MKIIDNGKLFEKLIPSGLLFEINRVVLHQFGLALTVVVDDDITKGVKLVIQEDDDPEGIDYSDESLINGYNKFEDFKKSKQHNLESRFAKLGTVIQKKEE